MKLRTSYFNITALRKDILRFAPVWEIYLIGGLLFGISAMNDGALFATGREARALSLSIPGLGIVNLLYAILCAQLLFGDQFNSRLCNALHAFPLRREGWFITHTAAGVLFSLVPNLIMSLCFMPFMDGMWYVSLIWLLGLTLQYLFFFGLSVFCAMLTGNRFAMGAVYLLVNFLSVILLWFAETIYMPLLPGVVLPEGPFYLFCPVVQMFMADAELVAFDRRGGDTYIYQGMTEAWWYLGIIAVIGLVLLGSAVLLYRKRKLESAGDFVAFRCLNPVITVVFAAAIGAVFEMFGSLFLAAEHVALVVGIVVGYFVIRMLLKRTVRVFRKGEFVGCVALVVGLVITVVIAGLDPFGLVKWVPQAEQVASITISETYYFDPAYQDGLKLTEQADMNAVIEAHGLILADGHADAMSDDGYGYEITDSVYLIYNMKDGRTFRRQYTYPADTKAAKLLSRLFSRPEYVLRYEDWETFVSGIRYIDMDTYSNTDYRELFPGNELQSLMEAVKADCEAGRMARNRSATASHYIGITTANDYLQVNVYSDCENTLRWLREHPKYEVAQ